MNEKLIQEIINNTNYTDITSVKEDIENGDIEIYENKEEYQKADYILDERYYLELSNGYIVHFIHG